MWTGTQFRDNVGCTELTTAGSRRGRPTVFDTTVYDPDTAAFLTFSLVLNMVILGRKGEYERPIVTEQDTNLIHLLDFPNSTLLIFTGMYTMIWRKKGVGYLS